MTQEEKIAAIRQMIKEKTNEIEAATEELSSLENALTATMHPEFQSFVEPGLERRIEIWHLNHN